MCEKKGIIYLMTTTVAGLVKIGKTRIDNYEARIKFLESNGYQNVSGLKINFAICLDNYDEKENLIHNIFSKSRVGKTELFSLDVNMVYQLLSAFDGEIIYPSKENKKEIFKQDQNQTSNFFIPNGKYFYKVTKRVDKKSYFGVLVVKNGVLTLKKDSTVCPFFKSKSFISFRKNLQLKNSVLQHDVVCSSVSLAASIVSGKSEDGWICWKDKDGKPIDIYRKKAIAEE